MRSLCASLLPLLCLVQHASGQASFETLADLPGGANWTESFGVSRDGSTVVGHSDIGGSLFSRVYAAVVSRGEIEVAYADPNLGATATALGSSADGTVIGGFVDFGLFNPLGRQAFVWTPGDGGVLIGDLAGGVSGVPRATGRAVSDDGRYLVGIGESNAGTEAFRYEIATGTFEPLGDLPGGSFASYAYACAADGSVVVGLSIGPSGEQQAFRWTAATGMVGLGFMPTPAGNVRFSSAEAVTPDASVIVGHGRSFQSPNGNEAFRWTASDGMVALGDLPGGAFQSWAYDVSADGNTIVGRATIEGASGPFGGGSAPRAFIWSPAAGMRDLQAWLSTDFNLDLTDWRLDEARGISADGTVIVGIGRDPTGTTVGWIARLPRPCGGDTDGDRDIDLVDLASLLTNFGTPTGAGPSQGDFDADADVDLVDLATLLVAFGSSCP